MRQYEAALAFAVAQGLASPIAMVCDYRLNNIFTYRDQGLHGHALATDMLRFIAICSVGAGINLLGAIFCNHATPWWLAGLLGALVGSVWNYAISSTLVWRR